jgi:hypothetical protein
MRHYLKNKLKQKELGGVAHMVETFLASTWQNFQTPVLLKKMQKGRNRNFISITKGISTNSAADIIYMKVYLLSL